MQMPKKLFQVRLRLLEQSRSWMDSLNLCIVDLWTLEWRLRAVNFQVKWWQTEQYMKSHQLRNQLKMCLRTKMMRVQLMVHCQLQS